jgi:hypothetical protein
VTQPERRKFALTAYSVERRDHGWYYGRPFDPPKDYRGPYLSLASVTLVIARQLRREIERRDFSAKRELASPSDVASFP